MTKYTDELNSIELIRYIANDYVELSHDKIVIQRDHFRKICQSWLDNHYKDREIE